MKHVCFQGILAALLAFVFAVAPLHAEEIERRSVMRGTRYETPYYIKTGAQSGPTIMVIGGLHGDEAAGYLAARKIANWKVTRGRLVVMPDAHREAIRRNTRGYPGNMNNMFPGKANGSDMERLAYEIWKVIENVRPDLLLTLHESRDFHARNPARYGQTFCFDFQELVPSMTRVLRRANANISPRLHKFLIFVDPYPNCPTYNAWSRLKVPATSIETSRTLPLKTRVRYQLTATQAFLDEWKLGYQQNDAPRLATTVEMLPIPKVKPETMRPVSMRTIAVATPSNLEAASPTVISVASTPKSKNTASNLALLVTLAGTGAYLGFIGWRIGQSKDKTARK
ncbi:MAG TPA: succinylglutamate desuccinylase/aspartoacylase family protein [Abditibacteriaceae bacterium]|jgi:predicted deacylase